MAVIAVGILILERFYSREPFLTTENSGKEATLLIDFDSEKRMFEGEVIEKMTVLDVLNASVNTGKIKLRYSVDTGNNTIVAEIDGHSASDGKNFSFYINGKETASANINKIFVNPGDEIIVKLK